MTQAELMEFLSEWEEHHIHAWSAKGLFELVQAAKEHIDGLHAAAEPFSEPFANLYTPHVMRLREALGKPVPSSKGRRTSKALP